MFSFVRRRMYTSALPLIIVLLGVFLLARLTGDPTNLYLPESATEEQRAEFAAANGFNDPLITQLLDYFKGVIHLDFGASLRTGESAAEMALRAFPATLQLALTTMLLAIVGAIVIGCWAAYRPNSLADRFSSLLSMTAASIPDFWFAITGVWLFAVLLGWLPTSGTDAGMLSWILPIATLMIRPLGVLTQVVRGAMVSALSAPYVRLARSKGAGDFRIVTHHALRNAAAPALTVAGDLAVGLINGAVVVEAIFGWPGIGKLMIDAILQRDFAVLQAAVLLTAVSIFLLNIFIDACYALLDARVREPAKV
ncbi:MULTISPECIES: ABC transporter permease [Mycolicibacterium]|jgi:peptide/nickel transport system permease protein|uniref:ABC transporter permease n=1 Tax=Mycolicibacterium TaxID=1866885 RepID=UPI0005613D0B|nr:MULTISPECIES: ABC transporter permease [Mycolicibacterium]MDW5611539.1 ABC transporter permease [Mycolicibacterium sp. D5.8-2]QZT57830.1 ABC transporter permease [Mycolicibacterium austroafricanum]QZY47167.1 ABC transporter permease [Mycolicibacterium austroafricanum]UJL30913.1 ABC transporter permease [Mycolicibacterium vanbaalenii]WND57733.1 ABC transporter permease [Mycolicibacterium vanbaalenii]